MDFSKLYIKKCIDYSAGLSKFSPDKKSCLTTFCDFLLSFEDCGIIISELKKITETSKMAIHISQIHEFCNNAELDFLSLSQKFVEHAKVLSGDIERFLEVVNSEKLKEIINNIEINLKNHLNQVVKSNESVDNNIGNIEQNNKLKEEFILSDDDEEENSYEFYSRTVLSPVKELDSFLKRLEFYETDINEMEKYQTIMEKNAYLSKKYSFELIADMHFYFSGALKHIIEHRLIADKELIEKMRACLIVIAALVRQKDVDITNYLNKADKLGKLIQNIKG
jgi:hypothetical protein